MCALPRCLLASPYGSCRLCGSPSFAWEDFGFQDLKLLWASFFCGKAPFERGSNPRGEYFNPRLYHIHAIAVGAFSCTRFGFRHMRAFHPRRRREDAHWRSLYVFSSAKSFGQSTAYFVFIIICNGCSCFCILRIPMFSEKIMEKKLRTHFEVRSFSCLSSRSRNFLVKLSGEITRSMGPKDNIRIKSSVSSSRS